jgi:hypothetical protein
MTEKRQTSQAYIIRILQHFATKWNTTSFVMLVQVVMKFLSRSAKFCSLGNRSIRPNQEQLQKMQQQELAKNQVGNRSAHVGNFKFLTKCVGIVIMPFAFAKQ